MYRQINVGYKELISSHLIDCPMASNMELGFIVVEIRVFDVPCPKFPGQTRLKIRGTQIEKIISFSLFVFWIPQNALFVMLSSHKSSKLAATVIKHTS